jgi:hypothetical protein
MGISDIFRRKKRIKPFTAAAIVVFAIVALLHLLRLIFCWDVTFNGIIIPFWPSVFGFIVATGLAYMLWREGKK